MLTDDEERTPIDMKYQSINELQSFSFRDCVITRMEYTGDVLRLELEALIVLPFNSQNTNYTESYAGPVTLRLTHAQVLAGVQVGWREYDADGKLTGETPDRVLDEGELAALPERSAGAYLPGISVVPADGSRFTAVITIEFPPEEIYDTLPTETFELTVSFRDAAAEWDFYQNKTETREL